MCIPLSFTPHTHTDSQNCLRTGCNMMMSPLTWLAVRLLREGGEMLGERERGRAKKRDGVRENAGNIYGWRVFVKRSKRHLCACFSALTPLWCVCELECFGAQPEGGGGPPPIPHPPRSMRRLICQRICDCEFTWVCVWHVWCLICSAVYYRNVYPTTVCESIGSTIAHKHTVGSFFAWLSNVCKCEWAAWKKMFGYVIDNI